MLTAITNANEQVIAWETSRDKAPFRCPECDGEVILKQGQVVTHHFAHKRNLDCEFGSGESEEHLKAKRELYEALSQSPNCSNWAMERRIWEGEVRPDLSGRIDGIPVVIEVQRSNTTIETIVRRFKAYNKRGVAMLWVLTNFSQRNHWKWDLYRIYNEAVFVYQSGVEVAIHKGISGYVIGLGVADITKDFALCYGQDYGTSLIHPLVYSLKRSVLEAKNTEYMKVKLEEERVYMEKQAEQQKEERLKQELKLRREVTYTWEHVTCLIEQWSANMERDLDLGSFETQYEKAYRLIRNLRSRDSSMEQLLLKLNKSLADAQHYSMVKAFANEVGGTIKVIR